MRFALVALMSVASLAAAQTPAHTPDWNYQGRNGAQLWSRVDPAWKVCSEGHAQAPINIRGARLNKKLSELSFHTIAAPLTLENNGRTIVARTAPGNYVTIDNVRYDLVEFDLHHPAETAVQGKLSDMEVHLRFQSAEAKQIIVAVRVIEDVNAPNAVFAALWPHLPKKAGQTEQVAERINPGAFLPADRGYWTFDGSLSTPPCTEGVRWYVFEQEQTLSRDQLKLFSNLFPLNTRPIQELHGRRIEANE